MCGIAGIIGITDHNRAATTAVMNRLRDRMKLRGPDAEGLVFIEYDRPTLRMDVPQALSELPRDKVSAILYNARGLPPTETAQIHQPILLGDNAVVHNGQLSNDRPWLAKEPRLPQLDTAAFLIALREFNDIRPVLETLEGSRAIALYRGDTKEIVLARDYLGLHVAVIDDGWNPFIAFSSEPITPHISNMHFDSVHEFEMPEWTHLSIALYEMQTEENAWQVFTRLRRRTYMWGSTSIHNHTSAAVVLSGGMDSTVAATWTMRTFKHVSFIHYLYGARAEAAEEQAVKNVAKALSEQYQRDIPVHYINLSYLKTLGGSSLTDLSMEVATGELSVEKATEWVPARNIAMIGMAASYCDRHDIGNIVLGLNAGEGNVFSDNSKEFYRRMAGALALGTHARPRMRMPLGNMQKRHILGFGLAIDAPIHLSWSCYHNGAKHCGRCGPCLQRKYAAVSNSANKNVFDSIEYEDNSMVGLGEGILPVPKDFDFEALIEHY